MNLFYFTRHYRESACATARLTNTHDVHSRRRLVPDWRPAAYTGALLRNLPAPDPIQDALRPYRGPGPHYFLHH
ncbi:hypothetical protein RR46_05821 [Papilio xuthus]|uniref:Uncharacterized protein n=1 Tax=Papilio xuthus TaxID=66420 RepID=A0A194PPB0_PAPXU|nr:hypothetical protein RR46_05821 [Papilio xuthus]